jgi:hypothetical protein
LVTSGIFSFVNIYSLYGFWGERELWATQFGLNSYSGVSLFLPLLVLILFGFWKIYKSEKKLFYFLLTIFIFAGIFSVGVGESIFKNLNQAIFDHVWFWAGFRDSQKWTAVIVLLESVTLGIGFDYLFSKMQNKFQKIFFTLAILLLILFYTSKELLGFGGYLQAVQYPKSWYEADQVLQKDVAGDLQQNGQENCEAIYLPWHMYFSLDFNHGILTGNPAQKFFHCRVYTSLDPEFYSLGDVFSTDEKTQTINTLLQTYSTPAELLQGLRKQGVKYILASREDFSDQKWAFLTTFPEVIHIYDSQDIVLLKIVATLK